MAGRLDHYNAKRDFAKTSEPKGKVARARRKGLFFSVQKHDASVLHYDLRLEWKGVLLSWAVPKGPPSATGEKRLAMRTEDHPLGYGEFEGTIPKGQYGGGTVMLWDRGTWTPRGDADEMIARGNLKLDVTGERMRGGWALVRFKKGGKDAWLMVKEKDDHATDDPDALTRTHVTSVKTGREMEAIAKGAEPANRARPAGKRRRKVPGFVKPQLATLVDEAPDGDEWIHETKFDGYRCIVSLGAGGPRFYTRSGRDWTDRFGRLSGAFDTLPCESALLDGEVMAARIRGSAFSSLQRALAEGGDLVFFAFDLLSLDGEDQTGQSQIARRERLETLMQGVANDGALRRSDYVRGGGPDIFRRACEAGAEGIVSKRVDAPYKGVRTGVWRKVKCTRRQEFVVGGYTPSEKARPFASLLVGENGPEGLRYRGRVGTGFSDDELDRISGAMKGRRTSPFKDVPRAIARNAKWVAPELVVEVEFSELTEDGHIRHGAYLGEREDKPATSVSFETPRRNDSAKVAGIAISSPDRAVFPDAGCTKLDVARHYERVGERLVEIAGRRPLSLLRAPQGIAGQTFFQKHVAKGLPDALQEVEIEESGGTMAKYIYATRVESFVAAAQMGTLEFHIWGARIDRLDRPDRLVFDLDPDEGLGWGDVRTAAFDLRERLSELGLASGAMVTGGKGVHVWLPLRRSHDWLTVKTFARTVASVMSTAEPDRFVATMSKKRRTGRIFIDWLRNERGATAVTPYSLRARPGGPVAVPVEWDELGRLAAPNVFSIGAVKERLDDPCPYLAFSDDLQSIDARVVERLEAWSRSD